ncbi:MAG TPA: L-dopachrome tautomerase-related protein [Methylotenera sp.]|nr:L-dopachrome tautomerase-related protein [Methylotenera sp.]
MKIQYTASRIVTSILLASTFIIANGIQAKEIDGNTAPHNPVAGEIEVIAELPIRPGNVAATEQGRTFATVHPLDKPSGVQLIEITGKQQYHAWPSPAYQNDGKNFSDDRIDSPLGIYRDDQSRIWIVDMGMHIGKTRIWGFDIASGKLVQKIDLPTSIAPAGSFVQDLVVDNKNGWIYLADIADPGLIAVNMASGQARRFGQHPSLNTEAGVAMIIDGKQVQFNGKPAEVGVDPITLSADKETIYFGAMNGRSWYSVPAKLFRENASNAQIGQAITKVGSKPISDGAAIDEYGNHFFTNLIEHGIDVLTAQGEVQPFIRDSRLIWPDGVQFGSKSWLYISVNQLNTTPAFNGGIDEGKAPFHILRVKTIY